MARRGAERPRRAAKAAQLANQVAPAAQRLLKN